MNTENDREDIIIEETHSRQKKKGLGYSFRNMKFRQNLMVFFVLGSIVPLIISAIFIGIRIERILLASNKTSQLEELELVYAPTKAAMSEMVDAARKLQNDSQIREWGEKKYKSQKAFNKEYNQSTLITDLLEDYSKDIADITIYLKNPSISSGFLYQMPHLGYLSEDIENSTWYQKMAGQPNGRLWQYGINIREAKTSIIDNSSSQKYITLNCYVRDNTGKIMEVISIYMRPDRNSSIIQKRDVDTLFMFNDSEYLNSNVAEGTYTQLVSTIRQTQKGGNYSEKVVSGTREYLVTHIKKRLENQSDYFSLISVQDYQKVLGEANRLLLVFACIVLGCVALSVILIYLFAYFYQRRIAALRLQMHRVAQGEYDKVEALEGEDEIGELYRELENMATDIRELTEHMVEEQVQKEKIHTKQKEVEFKMLASQINPHFLYNTLETIRMKAVVNKQPEITDLVKMLAKILRYSIQATAQSKTLASEIQMVQYYLKIQDYRFGDRITSEVIVDDDVNTEIPVMPLIIQPIVENCFIHGLEEKDEGHLWVHVCRKGDDICIRVRDDGVGMNYVKLGELRQRMRQVEASGKHIGVQNVHQRIVMQYGEGYGLHIESEPDKGTIVEILLPDSDENL